MSAPSPRSAAAAPEKSVRRVAGVGRSKAHTAAVTRTVGATTRKADEHTPSRRAYSKVSVTMPSHVLDEARERAAERGLSAYVGSAVEAALAADRLGDLIAELDAEHGPVPAALIAEAEAAWPDHG